MVLGRRRWAARSARPHLSVWEPDLLQPLADGSRRLIAGKQTAPGSRKLRGNGREVHHRLGVSRSLGSVGSSRYAAGVARPAPLALLLPLAAQLLPAPTVAMQLTVAIGTRWRACRRHLRVHTCRTARRRNWPRPCRPVDRCACATRRITLCHSSCCRHAHALPVPVVRRGRRRVAVHRLRLPLLLLASTC
jgi:hypothetical protein